jgi:hypothetical protein
VGRILSLGLVGTGVALTATGLMFELRAKSASDELSDIDRGHGVYDQAKDRAGRRDETVGVILMAAGGLATVTGLTLYLVLSHQSGAQIALTPALGQGGPRGLILKGSF